MKKIVIYAFIILSTSCFCLTSCNSVKKVDYSSFGRTTTKEEMKESMDSEPNETKELEDGGTEYIYKKSVYKDYTGTMSYQYFDDMLFLSKWTHKEKEEEKAIKVYQDICEALTEEYKNGNENEENHSTTFETKEKYIIAAYAECEDGYDVCITEMLK